MKKHDLHITYSEFEREDELAPDDRDLLSAARDAASSAYAPYSHFHVGAAVRLQNGRVVTGNNQENAAYPSGLCAERVALFTAAAQCPGVPITALAISATSASFKITEPVPPCGACRQVMAEYETLHKQDIRIILSGETGKILVMDNVSSVLPFRFNGDHLKR